MTCPDTPDVLSVLVTVGTSLGSNRQMTQHPEIRNFASGIARYIDRKVNAGKMKTSVLNNPVLQDQIFDLVTQMEEQGLLLDTTSPGILPETFATEKLSTAELQSSLRWLIEQPSYQQLNFNLYPSMNGDCLLNALVFKTYIRKVCTAHIFARYSRIGTNITPLPISVTTKGELYRSVDDLFNAFDTCKKSAQQHRGRIVINSTGGFKAISAFATLYAQIHRFPCFYIFDSNSANVVELPPLPLSFALDALDDEMNLLKGIQTLALTENTLGLEQEKVFNSLPDWVRGMLIREAGGKIQPLGIAQTLLNSYEETRRRVTGPGSTLLGFLEKREPRIAQAFHEQINGPWSQLWMGDQIPETVEHSRRHSKRLMETGGNIFRSIGDKLEEMGMMDGTVLSLLIASIYLHDIGHTALTFLPGNAEGPAFPLDLFPSAVREVHHLLSCELIREKAEELLPADKGFTEMHQQLVPLICAHHRGYTTLTGNPANLEGKRTIKLVGELLFGDEDFAETLQPLKKRIETLPLETWGITPRQALQAAALLRVIDGCDVQADRAVSPEYLKARLERTKTEAAALWQRLLQFGKIPVDFTTPIELKGVDPERTSGISIMDRIADWGDKLKTDDAQNGTIPKNVREEIEHVSKLVYERIFQILNKKKLETQNFDFLTRDLDATMTLSLLNRVTFKWEQFIHFYKHISVSFVLPIRKEDKCTIGIWCPDDSRNSADLKSVKKDIWDEFTKGGVSEFLKIIDDQPRYEGNLFQVEIMNYERDNS